MKNLLLLTTCLVLLAGCKATTSTSYYPQEKFPQTKPEEILILDEMPQREHLVIGEIKLLSATYSEDELRRKASEMGGNAVILEKGFARPSIVERGRKEVIVGRDGKIITYDRPQIYPERDTQTIGKVILFLD